MNGDGKSDSPIVPGKRANDGHVTPCPEEFVEGRGLAKGNSFEQSRFRTQSRADLSPALERIRQASARERQQRFTALWHHVYNIDHLRAAYQSLERTASAGVDNVTWAQYGEDLEYRLTDLSDRLRRGAYRPEPVKRVYLPKPDGRVRPIGMPTLEDKIVQRTVAKVLEAIYESDFKGFSYGFRPGRSAHDALDALSVGIRQRRISWILDADISGFFDAIDHDWMLQFLAHRIADKRVLRQVSKWLKAGVLEGAHRVHPDTGTPQGGSISPLLANVYLHYVFDLWVDQWRKRQAKGDVIIVRYADDFVVGFQHQADAERFRSALTLRLSKFGLTLNNQKTRLIEFGRFAHERRRRRGLGKPETFNFLGFTHICAVTRQGWFTLLRRPMRSRMSAKLKELNVQLKFRRHFPIAHTGRWLQSVLRGWYQYYAVPMTYHTLVAFRRCVARHWYRALRRRSQRSRITWRDMHRLIAFWLPVPRILHPHPGQRLHVRTRGRSPVR